MNKLKDLRKETKKTQQQLADDLGVNRQTYCNYENGTREPDIETLKRLAKYFGTSIDFLVGQESKIVELNSYPDYKRELIEKTIKLNELECTKADAYVSGLLESRAERDKAIEALNNFINSKKNEG